ncbi:MAG: Holliday junction resolvase RuvX [Balneolaceae bacterium]|nr:Holliday junction resolvase RuvX [Balneolaceae bacterium]
MSNYGRFIGVDVGTKHVGLARTDLLKTVANPIGTFSPGDAVEEIKRQVASEKIEKIIVGWPLTPEGNEGKTIHMVKQYINRIQNRLPDMEIVKFDERYTSKEAEDAMFRAGVPLKERRNTDRINKVAAAIILQKYLEQTESDHGYTTYRYI